jgi:hypothetical protein
MGQVEKPKEAENEDGNCYSIMPSSLAQAMLPCVSAISPLPLRVVVVFLSSDLPCTVRDVATPVSLQSSTCRTVERRKHALNAVSRKRGATVTTSKIPSAQDAGR